LFCDFFVRGLLKAWQGDIFSAGSRRRSPYMDRKARAILDEHDETGRAPCLRRAATCSIDRGSCSAHHSAATRRKEMQAHLPIEGLTDRLSWRRRE
jgi:hypothetical protein